MIRSLLTIGFGLALLLASTSSPARAQGWTLDAYAGRAIYDPVAASVGTSNGVLGLRYGGVNGGWLYLSAALPFASGDPLWGAGGLGRRFTIGESRVSAGLDLGAHGHGYRDPSTATLGGGATLEALPFVALDGAAARLEVRSGLVQYAGAFSGATQSRTLHDSGARLLLRASMPLELTGEARYVRAEEGGYPYAGGSTTVEYGKGQLWASVGHWFADALPDVSWGTGASFRAGRRSEVWVAIRQDASDPLYWNQARRSWNIGVSRRLGKSVEAPAPVPAQVSPGRVIIRLPLSEASAAPFIAGDFTGWKPVAMVRSGEFWVASLAVEPGYHHYAFRTADGTWFVPDSVPGRRDDGFGGVVAVLTVP